MRVSTAYFGMHSLIIKIIYLFFIWYLEIAAEDQKASWVENIRADFYPGLASGNSIPSGIGHSALVAAFPAYEIFLLNSLYNGRGLSFGVSTSPGIPLTSKTGESAGKNTSMIPTGNIISSGLNITKDIGQSLETTFPTKTGATAGIEAGSEVRTLSPDSHLSKSTHQYPTDTNLGTDLASVISKSSENSLDSGPSSVVTPLPFGYRLYSRAGIKKEKGFSIPQYLNRAGVNSGITLSVGSEPGSGVYKSSPISQSSEKDLLSGINAIPREGTVSESNAATKTGISTGTNQIITSDTAVSTEKVHYINNLFFREITLPIHQYTGITHSSRTSINSEIEEQSQEITPPPPISIQIDRPFLISMPQTISQPGAVPRPFAVLQRTPATHPVANNVPDPVPLPAPFLKAFLVPTEAVPIGKNYY